MTENDNARKQAERLGRRAEGRAALFLRLKGYRVMARRYRTPVGEIDLVVRRGRTLAFVEVKARDRHDDAVEAVSPQGRRRIARAAEAWLMRYPAAAMMQLRFDVVIVAPGLAMPRHLRHVFHAGGAL